MTQLNTEEKKTEKKKFGRIYSWTYKASLLKMWQNTILEQLQDKLINLKKIKNIKMGNKHIFLPF